MSVPFGFAKPMEDFQVETKRLGPLPIIRHFLDRLEVRSLIDSLCPKPGATVSNGECIEALVMSIFLDKQHALSRVAGLLEGYDLPFLFRSDFDASCLHDTRIGECLDDLYENAQTIYGDIVANAIRVFHIKSRRLNLDISKLLLHGEYDCPNDYVDHAETIAFPARGYNPEGRWDLRQLLFQLLVDEECIPLLYRLGDGNAAETNEYLALLKRLDTIQADVSKALLAVDCKMCAASTLMEAAEQQLRLVTLVPESFSLQRDLIASASQEDLPVLLQVTEKGTGKVSEYRGTSYRVPLLIDVEADGVRHTKNTLWRYLVVYSSEKARLAQEQRDSDREEERARLEKETSRYSDDKLFACRADAETDAQAWIKNQKLRFHRIIWEIVQDKVKQGRGKKPNIGMRSSDQVGWGIAFKLEDLPSPVYKYDPEGMFVLLTTVTSKASLSDTEILEGYKGRNVVEISFSWLKGDAAVCPMWLKLPSRIMTMGFVFVVWSLIYALIQRELRHALQEQGGTCPHPDKRQVERPTTRGVFDILAHVSVTRVTYQGQIKEEINEWHTRYDRVLELLNARHLYKPNSRGAP